MLTVNEDGPSVSCPDRTSWQRFISRSMSDAEIRRLDAHLESCNNCQSLLERIHSGESLSTIYPLASDDVPRLPKYQEPREARQSENPPIEIPGFSDFQEIGRGGMGVVYRAEQNQPLRRTVAIKVVSPKGNTKQRTGLFTRETSVLASLKHPSIATIHGSGILPDSRPYFVMEFVDGQTLRQYCEAKTLTLEDRLRLMERVCRGVQHAHNKGVLHRDLKPANLLVAEIEKTHHPKIIDFGLAKLSGATPTEKVTNQSDDEMIVGTLGYMSPEQMRGEREPELDSTTDIFSLGVVCYEILTGCNPFRLLSPRQQLKMMIEHRIPKPSVLVTKQQNESASAHLRSIDLTQTQLIRFLQNDVDAIVMKALSSQRGDRYQTADAFADDMVRVLTFYPVTASESTGRDIVHKFYRRNRASCWAALSITLITLAGGIGTTVGLSQALAAQRRANEIAQRELTQRRRSERLQSHNQLLQSDLRTTEENAVIREKQQSGYVRTSAHLLHSILEGMNPELAAASASTLRESILDRLKWAGSEIVKMDAESNEDLLVLKASLARSLNAFGEFETSVQLWQNVVDQASDVLPKESDDLSVARLNLAKALRDTGQPEKALAIALETRKQLVKRHDDTSMMMLAVDHIVAGMREASGDLKESLAIHHRIVTQLESINAAESELWADCISSMAKAQLRLGAYQDALESTKSLIAYYDKVRKEDHPHRIITLQNMALALAGLGDSQNALSHLQDALRLAEQQYPEESIPLDNVRLNLAVTNCNVTGYHSDDANQAVQTLRSIALAHPGQLLGHHAMVELTAIERFQGIDPERRTAELKRLRQIIQRDFGEANLAMASLLKHLGRDTPGSKPKKTVTHP